jgi:hypothetical protein
VHDEYDSICKQIQKRARDDHMRRLRKEDERRSTCGAAFVLLILLWLVAEAWHAGFLP